MQGEKGKGNKKKKHRAIVPASRRRTRSRKYLAEVLYSPY
jgi:hypothetical protein